MMEILGREWNADTVIENKIVMLLLIIHKDYKG
jgi:hypothetical protein